MALAPVQSTVLLLGFAETELAAPAGAIIERNRGSHQRLGSRGRILFLNLKFSSGYLLSSSLIVVSIKRGAFRTET